MERRKKLKQKFKHHRNVKLYHIEALKVIVEEHPEYYLDEFAEALLCKTHSLFSLSTINRMLKNDLNLSLQVCFDVAKQRNEHERALYLEAL